MNRISKPVVLVGLCALVTCIALLTALFITHLVSSVIYHAERDKGKRDLRGGRRQVLVEWEGQNQPKIELNDATVAFVGSSRRRNQFNWKLNVQADGAAAHSSALEPDRIDSSGPAFSYAFSALARATTVILTVARLPNAKLLQCASLF
jgi:hypothetical protein